jgi:hypothetical protein
MYGLEPLDARLPWGTLINPTADDILAQLQRANDLGHEGLVLRQGNRWIKIKPEATHDVAITGYGQGKGKHLGRLGYVTTAKGDVGTGFTDNERKPRLICFERPTVRSPSMEPASRLGLFSAAGRLQSSSSSTRPNSHPSICGGHCGPDKLPIDELPATIRIGSWRPVAAPRPSIYELFEHDGRPRHDRQLPYGS